jgi:ABC-type polysaccharide/polyol phosphate transport system ATPase subunit
MDIVIQAEKLTKIYPLYDKPIDRLKEALHPFRKKYHHNFFALNEVTFNINKGDTVGIIGQNGSGKSTLLKIITGVISKSSGDISVIGKISSLLELGTGFNPELTGLENIFFFGTINNITEDKIYESLDNIISFADIGEFINQPVKTYSSGMFVRLAFSCAIQIDPEILIIDEAFAVGDMRFVQKCIRKLEEFKNNNKTLLLVSHDIGYIQNMASKILWLDKGILKDSGSPKKIIKNYISYMSFGLETQKEINKTYIIDNIEDDTSIDDSDLPNSSCWTSTKDMEFFGEGGAKIIRASLINLNKQKIVELTGGENLELHLEIETNDNVEEPIIGFLIKNKKGDNIIGVNTSMYNKEVPKLIKGKKHYFIFNFFFPKLLVGEYSLSAAIANGTLISHKQLDWVHDVIIINVVSDMMYQKIGSMIATEDVSIKININI